MHWPLGDTTAQCFLPFFSAGFAFEAAAAAFPLADALPFAGFAAGAF
eukprot:CAMPEP_0195041182 /NCGR_PEP_ID=MMETSP0347-20130606/231_1 /TAXON_ID=2932 /ORGANISM="Alexandrium fundyense, Strain CCMP1719" /LENGTH=46 /DNA_ID= /DNA_START= /DNA_END= /DNA_ORIENTATION=